MRLFNPFLYYPYHLLIISILTLFCFFLLNNRTAKGIRVWKPLWWTIIYVAVFTLVVGLRPVHGAFGDTETVARTFYYFRSKPITIVGSRDSFFYLFQWFCAQHMEVQWFFLICEFLYVVPMVFACRKLMKNDYDIAILFCMAAFSFFGYATNGIRNGIACSFVMLAISLVRGNIFEKIVCLLLSYIAINVHRSTALPVLCFMIAAITKPNKSMFYFWVLSIIISLVAGGSISNFFTELGFDDRLDQYINVDISEGTFSRSGFRWDFLLYSSVPILLGYFLLFKKRVSDPVYLLLLGTYILSNSFWIMVIRAEFSNRFAYLSWFLYPIVLSYPLLRLTLWPKTQGQKTGLIMLGHLAFTLIMSFIL